MSNLIGRPPHCTFSRIEMIDAIRPGSDAELAALSGSTSLAPDLSRIVD